MKQILPWTSAPTANPSGRNNSKAFCGGIFPPQFFLPLTKTGKTFMMGRGKEILF